MKNDFLNERRIGLEEAFFQKEGQAALERLRKSRVLKEATGLDDGPVYQSLLKSGLNTESIAALVLTPLVLIAWADGEIHEKERVAVLQAAIQSGIQQDTPAYDLLESWLSHCPEPILEEAWNRHIKQLSNTLTLVEARALKVALLHHARHVSQTTGGYFGLGNQTNKDEQRVIDSIIRAFS